MGSNETPPDDALSNDDWQRLRRRQIAGQPTPFHPNLPPPRDDMPMGQWAAARQQQAAERLSSGARYVRQVSFPPTSERQWEVEAANSARFPLITPPPRPRQAEEPSSDNPVEEWATTQIKNGKYGYFDNSPEARGDWRNLLPPGIRGIGTPKCNQFVWDALTAGGVQPGRVDGGRIPITKDWGDPRSKIPGYAPVVGPPRPGDVVSDGGHVGIYSPLKDGRPGTISAASPDTPGAADDGGVVHNDWGFRKGQKPVTVWRPTTAAQK